MRIITPDIQHALKSLNTSNTDMATWVKLPFDVIPYYAMTKTIDGMLYVVFSYEHQPPEIYVINHPSDIILYGFVTYKHIAGVKIPLKNFVSNMHKVPDVIETEAARVNFEPLRNNYRLIACLFRSNDFMIAAQ